MTLGERIRSARLEKSLTQNQVAGTHMTRNMLSLLEKDAAAPSLKTLQYLSGVLGVSVGWLLEEADALEAETLRKVRSLYCNGEDDECLTLFQTGTYAEECTILLVRSALRKAKNLLLNGEIGKAEKLTELVMEKGKENVYLTRQDILQSQLLLSAAKCLSGEQEDGLPLLKDRDEEREIGLLHAAFLLNAKQTEAAEQKLSSMEAWISSKDGPYHLLCGIVKAQKGNLEEALSYLLQAENEELPDVARYALYRQLEYCYREQEDYRKAYRYATMQFRQPRFSP